ncbi:RDR2 (predicted) [Pycnogonum litorale]
MDKSYTLENLADRYERKRQVVEICVDKLQRIEEGMTTPEHQGEYSLINLKVTKHRDMDSSNLYSEDLSYFRLEINEGGYTRDNFFPLLYDYPAQHFIFLSGLECLPQILKDFLQEGMLIRRSDDMEVRQFKLFGYSVNQLKNRSCVLYDTDLGTVDEITQNYGEFDQIRCIPKKAARISQLLAPAKLVAPKIPDYEIAVIDDVTNETEYVFTDGCGFISPKLAKDMKPDLELYELFENCPYDLPSCFQIRIKSCKVLVMLDPGLQSGLQLRKSMEKFQWTRNGPHLLTLVDVSKPSQCSSLNTQIVRLISSLGIPHRILHSRLHSFFELIKRRTCEVEHDRLLEQQEKLLKYAIFPRPKFNKCREKVIFGDISQETIEWQLKKMKKGKLCIPIEKSRNLYGVPDPIGILEYGQCFIQVTIDNEPTVLSGKVVLTKNPCYHPGDVKVLEVVNVPELNYLFDCIVFPVKGERPHSNEISGGDLDGDKYFVSWDPQLIPKRCVNPAEYTARLNESGQRVRHSEITDHFCEYDVELVGKIDTLYGRWFKKNGAMSLECLELSNLFSKAVDIAKTGVKVEIPEHLQIQTNRNRDDVNNTS